MLPPTAVEALHSPGAELDPALRESMESRIGHDFGAVRVHRDAAADTAASELGAAAFTVGSNIAFRAGRYRPNLLTHELVHVAQQESASELEPERSEPDDRHERAADAVAHGGAAAVERGAAVPMLQLQTEPGTAAFAEQARRDAIYEADRKIAEIDEALTSGYIWWFERQAFTERTQAATAAIPARSRILRELAQKLSDFIAALEAGRTYFFMSHQTRVWPADPGHPMDSGAFREYLATQRGGAEFISQSLSWDPESHLEGYLFFPLRPDLGAVVPREAPTGVKRAAPTAPAPAPAPEPKAEPKPEPAPAPAPAPAPEPARAPERESVNEATGWYVQISDPRGRPTEVRELVAPADAAFVYAEPRTSKNFALFRDAGGRFYYNGPDGRVDLPGLLERFPAAANPAPRPIWQDEPQPSAGEQSPRRRPLTPRR